MTPLQKCISMQGLGSQEGWKKHHLLCYVILLWFHTVKRQGSEIQANNKTLFWKCVKTIKWLPIDFKKVSNPN